MRTENKYDKYAVCWIVFVKLILILIICSLFSGCSIQADEAFISVTNANTLEELWSYADAEAWGKTDGRANWNDIADTRHCSIYVMYPEWYGPGYCYNEIIGHETRHCFEGNFHEEFVSDKSPECGKVSSGKIGAWNRDNN